MKFRKIAASAAILALMFFQTADAYALSYDENTTYEVSSTVFWELEYAPLGEDTIEITKYIGESENVIIPQTIGSRRVSYIGDGAFANCSSVKSVVIPDSVTAIGSRAFISCSQLEEVTLSSRLSSVGAYAFAGCPKLKTITLPDSLVAIGNNAFSVCSELSSVTVPPGVVSIGEWAFAGCPRLTLICTKNSTAEMFASQSSIRYIAVEADVPGDADGDGEVTSADAVIVLRCSVGLAPLTHSIRKRCDADGDGDISAFDALTILKNSIS